jgi:signal transduction histidine kinase
MKKETTNARRMIAELYEVELRAYLAAGGESASKRAYETGRHALDEGLGLLDLADVHHAVVAIVVAEERTPADAASSLAAAGAFFAEAASPFEMTHRVFREAQAALRHVNERFEEESRRIAHTLHDDAGPLLVAIHLALKDLALEATPSMRPTLTRVREHLNTIEDQIRHLAREMRPTLLDDLGLAASIRFLAEGILTRNGLRVEVEDHLTDPLGSTVETSIYRIVQEALTNVARHASAAHARVRIAADAGYVHCSISDDGVGFAIDSTGRSKNRNGLGLVGIRERVNSLGGTLRIASAPGKGTEIHVAIPMEGSGS